MDLIPALRLGLAPAAPDVVSIVGGGGKTTTAFRLAREVVASGQRAVLTTTTRVAAHQLEAAPAAVLAGDGALPLAALEAALDAHGWCLLAGTERLYNEKQAGISPGMVDALAAAGARLGVATIVVEADGSRTLPVKAPAAHEPVVPASTTHLLALLGLEAVGAPLDEAHAHRPALIRALLGLPADAPARLTPAQAAHLLAHPLGGAKGRPPAARLVALLNKADTPTRLALGRLVAARLGDARVPALVAATGAANRPPVVERWEPFAALVLAAGGSSRFGSPKQVALVEGEPLAVRALRAALASGAQRVVVVTGAHADAVGAALAAHLRENVTLVHNPDWAAGQSTSLRAGLDALRPEERALLCLPVDQPYLGAALLRRLVQAWRQGADIAAPLAEGEVRGAPALFDRRLFPELRRVQGDSGGRALLAAQRATVAAVHAPAAMLRDVDLPGDLPAP